MRQQTNGMDDIFEILKRLPWWCSTILSGIVYLLVAVIIPAKLETNPLSTGIGSMLHLVGVFFAGLLLILSIIIFIKTKKGWKAVIDKTIMPYEKAENILTPTEKKFYKTLKETYELIICPKVRLEDLLNITISKQNHKERDEAYKRIRGMHTDFTMCDKELNILFCIELDDPSHQVSKNKRIDHFKDQALYEAGIPLVRIKTKNTYSTIDIKKQITTQIESFNKSR